MPTATASTAWPAMPIPPETKDLINLFFSLVDSKSPDAGSRLASEVFTPEGQFITPHGTNTGGAAISKSREHAWDVIESRKHEVLKVYASDAEGRDLVLIGRLTVGKKDGGEVVAGLVARVAVESDGDGKLKMGLYQAAAWG